MIRAKILIIISFCLVIGVAFGVAPQFSISAKKDLILEEISKYKSWQKVNDNPIEVKPLLKGGYNLDLSGG